MINKGDFVEIEFTGRVKDGGVFDTNRKDVAQKENLQPQKLLQVCVGFGMVVSGFDKALENKEIGKDYTIELSPKEAFGERNPSLLRTIPIKVFHQQQINPQPGMSFMMDNYLVRISAVSGGRVTADFNNPLAGKVVIYEFKVNRKIDNPQDKVKATMNFFFNTELPFKVENNKILISAEEGKPEQANLLALMDIMKDRFKEMLNMEIEVDKAKPAKDENADNSKENISEKAEIPKEDSTKAETSKIEDSLKEEAQVNAPEVVS